MPARDLLTRLLAMETANHLAECYRNFDDLVNRHQKKLDVYREKLFIKNSFDIDKLTYEIESIKAGSPGKQVFVVMDYLQEIPTPGRMSLKESIDFILAKIRMIHNFTSMSGKVAFLILSSVTKEESFLVNSDFYNNDDGLTGKLITSGSGSINIRFSSDLQLAIVRHPNLNQSKLFFLKNRNGSKPAPLEMNFLEKGLGLREITNIEGAS
jgi:hypothetical protein